jgi:large subunit ribosomal protein L21
MSKYAIIETGSKQYRVEPKSVIEVELLEIPEGQKEVTLDKVLMVRNGEDIQVGTPHVKGATVICDYLGDMRGKKVIHFRFRRRKNSRRKHGHRQNYSRLVVKEIRTGK